MLAAMLIHGLFHLHFRQDWLLMAVLVKFQELQLQSLLMELTPLLVLTLEVSLQHQLPSLLTMLHQKT